MPHPDRRQFLARSVCTGLVTALAPSSLAAMLTSSARSSAMDGRAGQSRVLPKLVLPHPSGASAEIYLQGGHVTSWKRANGDEMLFLSANSRFVPGETIRGGIPVIFPQFANLGPLPGHGFLKTAQWRVMETGADSGGAAFARMETSDTPDTRALWPHSFRATLRVSLDDALTTAIAIANTGEAAFSFHCVLHTYHRVGDLRQVSVGGVEGATYQDRLANGAERTEIAAPLRVQGETNRIYVRRANRIRIADASRGRVVLVDRTGFEDVVVWNPGELKGRTNTNLAEGEYLQMLAVESGVIAHPVLLAPGGTWTGSQRIHVE
jgi:glucose-6-phosphate 1-epimerase